MLQLSNPTPFKAALQLLPDRDGIDTVYTVVKATFAIGEPLALAAEQAELTLADEYHGDPTKTSIRAATDVSIGKPGTDIIINGSAWAPNGEPAWQMDVFASVGNAAKALRVFGDRRWDTSGGVASIAWIAPFTRMPLVWERAFGGSDITEKGPTAEPRNPVGSGFRSPNGAKPLNGLPLPNVETPAALITSWNDAPAPAGLGAIAPHWLPRSAFAGTYDERWQQQRSPYLPEDFDMRFCQVAASGFVTPQHLLGGEPVLLRGMTADGVLQCSLPRVECSALYIVDGGTQRRPCVLDTVTIEPDAKRLIMVWRAALPCDKKALKVREVEIAVERQMMGVAA